MKSWIPLFAVLVASGCVRSVTMSQARTQFAETHQEAKNRAAGALAEAARVQKLMRRFHKLVERPQKPPFPELRRLASSMDAAAKSLKAKTRGMQRLKVRLAKLGGKAGALRSDQPQWAAYQDLKRDLGRLERASAAASDAFAAQPQAFNELCAKHRIGAMDTKDYGPRMGARIKGMDGLLAKASQRVADVEPLLQADGVEADVLRRVQAAMVQLEGMTEARTEVRKTALRFRLETKAGAQAVIAPGMVTYNLFERLDHLESDLKAAGRRIDELVTGLPVQE